MALRKKGILYSMLCAPRVSSGMEAIASGFMVTRTWKDVTVDLERRALIYGKDEEGREVSCYAFLVPGTQNVECFLCMTKVPDKGYAWEISRAGGAEMHVYYKGAEIVTMTRPVNHTGYWFGGYLNP